MNRLIETVPADLDELRDSVAIGRELAGRRTLPPGSHPGHGRVRFEFHGQEVWLILDERQPYEYHGAVASVRLWFAERALRFLSFAEFARWLDSDLRRAFQPNDAAALERHAASGRAPARSVWNIELSHWAGALDEAESLLATSGGAVVVTGPTGVGKSAFLQALQNRLTRPGGISKSQADASHRAVLYPLECRLEWWQQTLAQALRGCGPAALLFVEDLPVLCGWPTLVCSQSRIRTRLENEPIATAQLIAALDSGLRLCTTARPDGAAVLRTPQLDRRLDRLALVPPDRGTLIERILPEVARALSEQLHLDVAAAAFPAAVRVSRPDWGQPGSAICVLKRAMHRAASRGLDVLGPDDVH